MESQRHDEGRRTLDGGPPAGLVGPAAPGLALRRAEAPERRAGESSYAWRLRQLADIDLEEPCAEGLWREVALHRRVLFRRLGRDVGRQVALVDYLLNVRPQSIEPTIIEARALEAIRRNATMDGLTGLYNRRYLEELLRREVQASLRRGGTCSLLLLDLDAFKQVNDEHGHRAGDAVLRAAGRIILRCVRATDAPCRYGGDEFAVLFSDTPGTEALTVAERIRATLARWVAVNARRGRTLRCGVSGGLGSVPFDTTTAEGLFAVADAALYAAKRAGGDRIASPPVGPPPRARGSLRAEPARELGGAP